MATIDGNQVLRDLKKTRERTKPNSGTISSGGKILAEVNNSKPILRSKTFSQEKLTPKEQFLNRIQQYNDFLVQLWGQTLNFGVRP